MPCSRSVDKLVITMVHMTRKRNLSDGEWLQLACESIPDNENRGQFLIATGVIGGLVIVGATSFPPAGVVFGAWCVYNAFKGNALSSKNLESIQEYGYVAHCLSGNNLRDFREQFGDDEAFRQVEWAKDRGFWVSGDAEDFASGFNIEKNLKSGDAIAIKRTLQPDFNPPTSLTQSVVDVYNGGNSVDIIGSMTDRISNSFILGIAGSGKGILLANALRVAKHKHQKLKIFYIDPKNDEREYGYTEGVADVVKRYKCETEAPEVVVKWLKSCFEEFDKFAVDNNASGNRTLLVLDEGTVLGLKSKLAKSTILIDRLSSLTSLGDSSGKNVWFVAQTPFVGGSGIDLSASSQLVTIALVSAENLGSLGQWKKSAMFTQPRDLEDLINKSSCKRAVYFGKTGQWYSMPKLTNYSGYDRDTRTDIKSEIVPDKFQSENVVNQLEKIFSEDTETELSSGYVHPLASKVIEIVSHSKDSVSLNAIRISKMWERDFGMSLPSRSDVREVVEQLIQSKVLIGNEGVGYRLANIN
jgi:hypothetical protein